MKEKALGAVIEEIERRIALEDEKAKGVQKKDWYNLLADTYDAGRGEQKYVMDFDEVADTALITCLDAVGHQWDLQCDSCRGRSRIQDDVSLHNAQGQRQTFACTS